MTSTRPEARLVYDDDCGFCTWWARYVAARSDVELVGYSELDEDGELRARLPADFERCSHLVTDDAVYSCGASMERALLRTETAGELRPLAEFLRQFEDYERLREAGYEWVADNRGTLGAVFSSDPPGGRREEG